MTASNSVSMSKIYRVMKRGHDEWYAERGSCIRQCCTRHIQLLQHQPSSSSSSTQQGILSFIKKPGSYTPPLLQMPLLSPRTLRRAHLILEMERMPVHRESILSVTGEILCIDGTKQVGLFVCLMCSKHVTM